MQSVAHTIASTAAAELTPRAGSSTPRTRSSSGDARGGVHRQRVFGRALQPLDAVFELLEQSGAAMRGQVELFERTIQVLREPSRRLESAAGIEPRAGARARCEPNRSPPRRTTDDRG